VLLTAIILIIALGAVFDFVRVMLLYALVWLAPIAVGMATFQVTLLLYRDEPSIIFWAVVAAAVATRVLIEALAVVVRQARS
jgi:hypothetical protein